MKPYVLIAEDESAVSELLQYNLKRQDYEVAIANDGEEALLMMEERAPDLLLLDWMLPKVSGIEVCRRVRSGGAKPFSTTELMARVRAVLRRIRPGLRDDKVIVGDIEIDRVEHRVTRNGNDIHLGPTEFRLLDYFMQHPGRVFSREQLLDTVWGSDVYVELRTVDVHVGRLRKALRQTGGDDPIRTVRSAGYALRAD